ncbi:MAG: hypothetical protein IJ836_06930 [Spirochaetales bacterium]|nr:hypothetical protein [Spirochaetales bacterium]
MKKFLVVLLFVLLLFSFIACDSDGDGDDDVEVTVKLHLNGDTFTNVYFDDEAYEAGDTDDVYTVVDDCISVPGVDVDEMTEAKITNINTYSYAVNQEETTVSFNSTGSSKLCIDEYCETTLTQNNFVEAANNAIADKTYIVDLYISFSLQG